MQYKLKYCNCVEFLQINKNALTLDYRMNKHIFQKSVNGLHPGTSY